MKNPIFVSNEKNVINILKLQIPQKSHLKGINLIFINLITGPPLSHSPALHLLAASSLITTFHDNDLITLFSRSKAQNVFISSSMGKQNYIINSF